MFSIASESQVWLWIKYVSISQKKINKSFIPDEASSLIFLLDYHILVECTTVWNSSIILYSLLSTWILNSTSDRMRLWSIHLSNLVGAFVVLNFDDASKKGQTHFSRGSSFFKKSKWFFLIWRMNCIKIIIIKSKIS